MKERKTPTLEWYYLRDREFYRVWRSDWFGDQFEVFTQPEFAVLGMLAKRLNIPLTEYVDDN